MTRQAPRRSVWVFWLNKYLRRTGPAENCKADISSSKQLLPAETKSATCLDLDLETEDLWQQMCQKGTVFQADSLLGIPVLLVAHVNTDHITRAQGSLYLFSWLAEKRKKKKPKKERTREAILKPQMFAQHSYWCQQEFRKQETTLESSKWLRAGGENKTSEVPN